MFSIKRTARFAGFYIVLYVSTLQCYISVSRNANCLGNTWGVSTCASGSRHGQEENKECGEIQHALVVADMDKKKMRNVVSFNMH